MYIILLPFTLYFVSFLFQSFVYIYIYRERERDDGSKQKQNMQGASLISEKRVCKPKLDKND